jgi:hypothetical protein
MKKLENFIADHLDDFNIDEPDEGHIERFAGKLKSREREPVLSLITRVARMAAVLIFIVISSIWLFGGYFRDSSQKIITLADISPEYGEAEIYYTALINRKYSEILAFDFHNSAEKEILLSELEEMDAIFRSLEIELNSERGNQRIIEAMIMHYQLKVGIMSLIIDQLHDTVTDGYRSSFNIDNIQSIC